MILYHKLIFRQGLIVKIILILFSAFYFSNVAFSITSGKERMQGDSLIYDQVYKENIQTVRLYRKGWELSYPVIGLNSGEQLVLSFDRLGQDLGNYSYTFIHCDENWQQSALIASEYITGFEENPVNDYKRSFNTYQPYVHYKISFPNDQVSFNVSGNYVLYVYQDNDRQNPVLTRRFSVSEESVMVNPQLVRPVNVNLFNTSQQINFTINLNLLDVQDPQQDIAAVVVQNNDWNHARWFRQPSMTRGKILEYDDLEKNIFPGGNEYRTLDISSVKYQSERVAAIRYLSPYYHFILHPDKPRYNDRYFYNEDLNGKYLIKNRLGTENDVDADYVIVHFSLQYKVPEADGDIYLYGALTNWECTPYNKLIYNFEDKTYGMDLLLKQGYYDYQYAFVKQGDSFPDLTWVEGSHFETENDYVFYIYYRSPFDRYDRLVGTRVFNTLGGKSRTR